MWLVNVLQRDRAAGVTEESSLVLLSDNHGLQFINVPSLWYQVRLSSRFWQNK